MGILNRFLLIFKAKANSTANRMEDPRETLDLAYQKQLTALQKMRTGLADVATSEKRLELQQKEMLANREKFEEMAKRALEQGREDLAVSMLTRGEMARQQLSSLADQIASLARQREQLEHAGARMQAQVEQLRSQKETLKAQYSASQAALQAGETMTGLSREMGDVVQMLDRAQEKMLQTQARAEAINELMDSGALARLAPGGAGGSDPVEAQIVALEGASAVDTRLSQLKADLGITSGSAQGLLGAGAGEARAEEPGAGSLGSSTGDAGNEPPTSES